ncbi:MAG TPA: hypothetical protein VG267_19965 [Terracidiphilus sp.]|nr:hypothetical protein [Terracidiphilus sp.]
MQALRWMRVPGDLLFSIGAALLGWFVLGLLTGHSYQKKSLTSSDSTEQEEHLTHAGD